MKRLGAKAKADAEKLRHNTADFMIDLTSVEVVYNQRASAW